MALHTDERRRFSRVPFQHEATLHFPGADRPVPVDVLDLSLNGALLRPGHRNAPALPADQDCLLKIFLDAAGDAIRMEGRVHRHPDGCYGLACQALDLDSATHLRRLVLLNLGDERLAERDFARLIQSPGS